MSERKHLKSFLSQSTPVHHTNAGVKTVEVVEGNERRRTRITVEFDCEDGMIRKFKSNTLGGLKLKDIHLAVGDKGVLAYKVHEGRKVKSFDDPSYVERHETEFIGFYKNKTKQEFE